MFKIAVSVSHKKDIFLFFLPGCTRLKGSTPLKDSTPRIDTLERSDTLRSDSFKAPTLESRPARIDTCERIDHLERIHTLERIDTLKESIQGDTRSALVNPDGGSAAVSYVNCIVDNDILGRGRASGTVITYSDGENTSSVVQNALFFDDEWPDAPTGSGRITPLVPQPTFQREFRTDIVVFADGVLPVSRSRSGADILPYLFAHHYTHEAGAQKSFCWNNIHSPAFPTLHSHHRILPITVRR